MNINIDNYLNQKTTYFIIATQLIQFGGTWVSSIYSLGWQSASIISYSLSAIYILYAIFSKNQVIRHLVLFSLLAGFLELAADQYSVEVTQTLVYPVEPNIWASPLYMPFAWVIVFTQMGYYSLLLIRWKGMYVAMIILFIAGGLYIPIYEHMAAGANWWYYQNTPMVFNAPYYVILSEALLSISIPPLIKLSVVRGYVWTVLAAIIQGIVIYISEFLSIKIIDLIA